MPTMFPYPGLRPFQSDQTDIFFGREAQTDELLRKLSQTRFLGVVGPSGCGKSSLVMAGMISALETGFMLTAGARWRIATMRPGSHPLRRLAEALMDDTALGPERTGDYATPFLEAVLRRGPRGLVEALSETPLAPNTNLLVLVDQFEELFRLRNEENRNEQDAFVALLLETVSQHELPVYVVITMRSDYLGDCALFPGLPEALNKSQYLTPRMDREQRQAAITGPAMVFGGEVELPLVNRLLNETGADPNQLPVLQHLLMRMWASTKPTKSVPQGAPFSEDILEETLGHVLTLSDYEKVGGLDGALSMHADQAFNTLRDEQKPIAEIMFRTLCERGDGRRDGRRPTSVERIADRAGVPPDRLIEVVEVFRNPAYGFLVPAPPEPVYKNTVIDITHESLIRLWKRLNGWVEQEAKSAETYRFLEQSARRWKQRQAALWGTPNLEIALAWKERERPKPEWAERYGGNFQLAIEFLKASEKEHERLQADAQKEQIRKLRRARTMAIGLGMMVFLLCTFMFLYWDLRLREHVNYYNSFIKVRGEPKGVGELTLSQVRQRPASLKIVKKGRWGHVLRMEAVNSLEELTVKHGIGTYLETSEDRLPREVAWEFNYDSSGRVSHETALDHAGKRLWGFVYSPPERGRENVQTGYFVDPNGYPRKDKKYSASFVETEYRETDRGMDEYRRYRNRGGQAIRGPDKAFGQVRRYDKKRRLLELTSLGPNDQVMTDEEGNATLRVTRVDDFANSLEEVALDASGTTTTVKDGWSIRRSASDGNGNITEEAYFDHTGKQTLHVKGYHKIRWERDSQGNIVKENYLDMADKPTVGDRGCYSLLLEYENKNTLIKESCLGPDEKLTANKDGFAALKAEYDVSKKLLVELSYYDASGRPVQSSDGFARATYRYNDSGKLKETTYFGVDGARTSIKKGYAQVTKGYNDNGQSTSEAYFGIKGEPVVSDEGYARYEQEFGSYGNVLHTRYYDPDDNRITSKDGYAGWSAKYDASANEIETVYLNAMDEPMLGKEGYAGWRSEYYETGNEKRRTYIGLSGERTLSSDGVAAFIRTYDSLGNEVQRRYLGLDGKPVTHREGYASWSARYDAHGNAQEMRHFDISGKPALVPWEHEKDTTSDGYSFWKKVFNPQNQPVEEAYFGINDEPLLTTEGWARATHKYDLRGKREESSYFGAFGERVLIKSGYHSVKRRYNDQGKDVEVSYFFVDGSPVASIQGFARLVKKYDAFARLTEQSLFDPDGTPAVLAEEGFHRVTIRYDERGRVAERAYFGSDKPILHRDGYHTIRYEYDSLGNEIQFSYQGLNGKPVMNKTTGYATVKMKYDARGNVVEQAYFDVRERPTSSYDGFFKTKATYNARSEITSQFWFDENDNPAYNQWGYAGTRIQRNAQGKVVYQVYLDPEERPVLLPWQGEKKEWGYASYRAMYDSHGNQTEVAYFDTDDKPTMTKNSRYHRLTITFNNRRQFIEQKTFDTAGRLAMNRFRYARLLRTYDERGKLTEVSAFDEKGRLSEAHYGYARMSMKYDAYARLIEEAYFGSDGRPKVLPGGCARESYQYDNDGNQIEDACYGSDHSLSLKIDGYARATRKYDSRRRIAEERYFDSLNKPSRLAGRGQHITRFSYDSLGNKIAEVYFGIHEEPALGISPDGDDCVRWTAEYDSAKQLIDRKCHRK